MPRTYAMARLRRVLGLAPHYDRTCVHAREAIEQLRDRARVDQRRRLVLSALGTAGYFTSIAGNEAKPVGNLFFAGEHTDSFYAAQGFLEGGANSGLRAATEVAALG